MKKEAISLGLATLIMGSLMVTPCYATTLEELEMQKESAHTIAEEARKIGLDETHEIIEQARVLWNEAHSDIVNGAYEPEVIEQVQPSIQYYNDTDVVMLAKLMFGEGRGIQSKTQLACIVWTVLNRVDAGYGNIRNVVTAPNQYHYVSSLPTVSDYGYDLKELALDVLNRWNLEKNGLESTGRVLPKDYLFFHGNGKVNIFRNNFNHNRSNYWNYSLPSPYEN